jgi:predicted O-linked N-acetylglucosamine transferase (SPINDLY family)
MVSAYFRLHSIGRLTQEIIARLSRQDFELTVFTVAGHDDEVSRHIAAAAEHLVQLPEGLWDARRRIAEAELDILFYPDLGMDVRTYFLAFARLAPVQCVSWGHPDTTGIPAIDYFISSALAEPDGARAHYSERLYRLATLPTFYKRRRTFGFISARRWPSSFIPIWTWWRDAFCRPTPPPCSFCSKVPSRNGRTA